MYDDFFNEIKCKRMKAKTLQELMESMELYSTDDKFTQYLKIAYFYGLKHAQSYFKETDESLFS